jgi:hypothetical protein
VHGRSVRNAARALALVFLLAPGCATAGLDVERFPVLGPLGARDSIAEINVNMHQGEVVHWDWSASRVVHFDVHTHPDANTVSTLRNKDGMADKDSFTAPSSGLYSLLWENVGGNFTIAVHYRVTGDGTLDSTYP